MLLGQDFAEAHQEHKALLSPSDQRLNLIAEDGRDDRHAKSILKRQHLGSIEKIESLDCAEKIPSTATEQFHRLTEVGICLYFRTRTFGQSMRLISRAHLRILSGLISQNRFSSS